MQSRVQIDFRIYSMPCVQKNAGKVRNAIQPPCILPSELPGRKREPGGFEGTLVQVVTALRIGLRPGRASAARDIRRLKLSALIVGFFDPLLQYTPQAFQNRSMLD